MVQVSRKKTDKQDSFSAPWARLGEVGLEQEGWGERRGVGHSGLPMGRLLSSLFSDPIGLFLVCLLFASHSFPVFFCPSHLRFIFT